ncbi:class I SAM-dependent methyltransferase [Mycolicibacterium aurum]|nr:class I SAM-dependent methyltransferase [Mycolicibacterium aurum]
MLTAHVKRAVKSSPALIRIAVPLFRIKSIALAHIPVTGTFPRFPERSRIDVIEFSSLSDFEAWRVANDELIISWKAEDEAAAPPDRFAFEVDGHCALCNESVDFVATTEYIDTDSSGRPQPKWREHLICPNCNMRNRVRAALHFAIQECGMTPDKRIYLTEQFGNTYRWLRGRFNHVTGSEFLSPGKASGAQHLGINHQDLHALSYPTASFDYVLSFDVLEHVPDYLAAFSEIARVLAPSGKLVMTVPFITSQYDTVVRASMNSRGQIEHFLPIEVHGNPTDPINGALCYRNFGWDVLDRLTDCGFVEARVHVYHNRDLGYLGGTQTLISATKAGQ